MADEAKRIYCIRPLEKTDIPTVAQWFVDLDDLASFDRSARVPLNLSASEEAWADVVGHAGKDGKCWFAIDDAASDMVGIVGLESISAVNRDAVIPLYVAKSVRRRGVGIRAVALILDLGFRQLGLNRVTSYYRADNEASRSLTTRTGFTIEGCMREAWFHDGRHVDMVVVGLLKSEWMDRRAALAAELGPETTVTFGRNASSGWSWPRPETKDA